METPAVSLWRSFKKASSEPYQLARLVDSRRVSLATPGEEATLNIVCDIDKTYLETEFDSLVRMARIAFETPADKVTVTGASEVLLLARWGDMAAELTPAAGFPRALHFVSSSPPQLRSVLEEKLMLDGLDWSSDTFKNQAYNIRVGRMDLLRQHVAYKSLAILKLVAAAAPSAKFLLIGDNAETDAYIYAGIRLLLSGQLQAASYRRYLEIAGVESAVAASVASLANIGDGSARRVVAVLIRNVPGYEFISAPPFTDQLQPFDNFYQAALLLALHGVIPASQLWQLTRSFHNHHGMAQSELLGSLQALAEVLAALGGDGAEPSPLARAVAAAITGLTPEKPAAPHTVEPSVLPSFSASLRASLANAQILGEDEILRLAAIWCEKLHAAQGVK